MFLVDDATNIYKKFIKYIELSIRKLEEEETELVKHKDFLNVVKKYKETGDITVLASIMNSTFISSEIRDAIKKVEFLQKNGATRAPQYSEAMTEINSDATFVEYGARIKTIDTHISDASKRIVDSKKVLTGDADIIAIDKLLKVSSLTEEEQMKVISYLIHVDCEKVSKKQQSDEELKREEYSLTLNQVQQKMEEAFKRVNQLYSDNYALLRDKNQKVSPELLEFKFEIEQKLKDVNFDPTTIDVSTLAFPEEFLGVLLLHALAVRDEIECIGKEEIIDRHPSEGNIRTFGEMITSLESVLDLCEGVVESIEENSEEEYSSSRLIFLLDDDGNPNIGYDELSVEEQRGVVRLFNKLENGQYDYVKDSNTRKIYTNDKRAKNCLYAIRKSDVSCAYVRVDEDIIMVIACDNPDKIFDNARQVFTTYYDKIAMVINMSREEKQTLVDSQATIRSEYAKKLSNGGNK